MNSMKCTIQGHENFDSCGICLHTSCELVSRVVCAKCLISTHIIHTSNIILFNDIIENKQNDLEYLIVFPEIQNMHNTISDGIQNKSSFLEISKKIETSSSMIYDILLNNFDQMNLNLKNNLEKSLQINIDSLSNVTKILEESNLFNNTSMLLNKQITSKVYEETIVNTIINSLIEIKNQLKQENSSANSLNLLNKNTKNEIEKIEKNLKLTYDELKVDIVNLFKSYSQKFKLVVDKSLGKLEKFKFICNNYCKLTNENILEEETYVIKGKNLSLIGDRPLTGIEEKWKILIEKPNSFSCCGFGIGSLDDPNIHKQHSTNGNCVIMCLCCNGPWNCKSMKITHPSSKLGPKLFGSEKNEVIFEINRNENIFKIFDSEGNLHSSYNLKDLPYNENLVPIMNCTYGVCFNFKIFPLKE